MKPDKKIRIVVLEYLKVGNYDTLMYVINADGLHEFRYLVNQKNPKLLIKSTNLKNFYKGIMNIKHFTPTQKHEMHIWFTEIGIDHVFPLDKYEAYQKEVEDIASSE
jgi:hypothetical protein